MKITVFIYKILRRACDFAGVSCSFSSDGEDYALWKYLNGIDNGVYIDIGSNHPIRHSNTFLFYLKGWRGVCIEPIPYFKKWYKILRSRDIFINAGISPEVGSQAYLSFYFYKKYPDNSTFDVARVKHLKNTFDRSPTSKLNIPILSVRDMLNVHAGQFLKNDSIHLLNIDTEGYELDIIKGFFSEQVFPWIVCVEDLGKTCHTIQSSKIHQLMVDQNYILGARTFLSSIYIKKQCFGHLLSPFVKEIEL